MEYRVFGDGLGNDYLRLRICLVRHMPLFRTNASCDDLGPWFSRNFRLDHWKGTGCHSVFIVHCAFKCTRGMWAPRRSLFERDRFLSCFCLFLFGISSHLCVAHLVVDYFERVHVNVFSVRNELWRMRLFSPCFARPLPWWFWFQSSLHIRVILRELGTVEYLG